MRLSVCFIRVDKTVVSQLMVSTFAKIRIFYLLSLNNKPRHLIKCFENSIFNFAIIFRLLLSAFQIFKEHCYCNKAEQVSLASFETNKQSV